MLPGQFNSFYKQNRLLICAKAGICSNREFISCMRAQNPYAMRRVRNSSIASKTEKAFPWRISRSSNVGRKTVDVSSRSQMCTRATPRLGPATSASTGCKFTIDTRPECTGSFTRSARDTASDIMSAGSACRSRSHWVAIPYIPSLQLHHCPTAWTSFSSGFLRRKSIELVRCKTIDLEVPADVDFVLEGYVQPGELRPEGPFGDHTGYYTAIEDYPVFHLTAITHRRDAVYPTTIVGIPPMEDYYIGDACVRIFLPVFKMNFPEIVDMTLPPEGVFHNLVFVSIRKQYPYQAFKVMHGLWGMGQMMFSKYIVAVDEDCDVHNTSEVLFRLCANTDPGRDTTIIKNPSDSLDHAPTDQNVGSHMGFDATRKMPGENYHRPWPELLKMTEEAQALVDALQAQMR